MCAPRLGPIPDAATIVQSSCQPETRLEADASCVPTNDCSSSNMLDRITDDLNFLLNGTEDMISFTPSHTYSGGMGGSSVKQKLPTIQETMVGISEEFGDMDHERNINKNHGEAVD